MSADQQKVSSESDFGCCIDVVDNVTSTLQIDMESVADVRRKKRPRSISSRTSLEQKACVEAFEHWNEHDQIDFISKILSRMTHSQHSLMNEMLEPLLQCDIIMNLQARGVPHLSDAILSNLDAKSLLTVELVSQGWQWAVAHYQLWRRLIVRHVMSESVWRGLAKRRGWIPVIYLNDAMKLPILLENRRAALGLRQRLADFPLLTENLKFGLNCPTELIKINSCGKNPPELFCYPTLKASFDHRNFSPNIPPSGDNWICQASLIEANAATDSEITEAVMFANRFYKQLYPRIIRDLKSVDENWNKGLYHLIRIPCHSDTTKGVYCLQYDSEKIVSGLRDDTIKVWRRVGYQSSMSSRVRTSSPQRNINASQPVNASLDDLLPSADSNSSNQIAYQMPTTNEVSVDSDGYECTQVLHGHTGSVLCLQYEANLLVSGSSDSTVRLWNLLTGECLHTLRHHTEAVLHVRFLNNILVTCSKDRSIAVWNMGSSAQDVHLRHVLTGHRAAVNVVDFDEKFIVSASGDRTIKVWNSESANLVRTLSGHRRGIACLQYRAPLIVSGSSDNTIRIWDIETGVCFRVLEGHEELVRCIRFDSKRIVSGAYDGKIKVWNLKAALNSRSRANQLCMLTLQQHTGRVFRLQFDDFQIVSSSHDDSILIWDFVRPTVGQEECDDGFADAPWGYQSTSNPNSAIPLVKNIDAANSDSSTLNVSRDFDSTQENSNTLQGSYTIVRSAFQRQTDQFFGSGDSRVNNLSSSSSPIHEK